MEKYITIEQAAEKLGKSVEEVRELMNSGQLRGVMADGNFKFKEADVNALAGEGGGAQEQGAPQQGEEQQEEAKEKEDTLMSLDADVVFPEGEKDQEADAAAETWIAADMENVFESEDFKPEGQQGRGEEAGQAKELEPGPLPLSPEKDDTALGTVLMEEEGEGGAEEGAEEPVVSIDPESGIATIASPTPGVSRTHMIMVNEPEPRHKAFTPLLVIAFVAVAFSLLTLWAQVMNLPILPGYVETVGDNLAIFVGAGLGVALITGLIGYVLDRQKASAEAAAARMGRR